MLNRGDISNVGGGVVSGMDWGGATLATGWGRGAGCGGGGAVFPNGGGSGGANVVGGGSGAVPGCGDRNGEGVGNNIGAGIPKSLPGSDTGGACQRVPYWSASGCGSKSILSML